MDLINLPRLRTKELQTVGENTVRICSLIDEVKPEFDKVNATLDVYKQGMQKERKIGTKAELDQVRDKLTYGLLLAVSSELHFPHNGIAQEQIIAVSAITDKYKGINRYRYKEQTAGLDNMLGELENLNLEPTALPTIQRWWPLIKEANEKFKAGSADLLEKSAKASAVSTASDVAPQLSTDLQNLYTLMFAHAQIGTNATIVEAYQELSVLINSVN